MTTEPLSPPTTPTHATALPRLMPTERRQAEPDLAVKIDVRHLSFFYGAKKALDDITIQAKANVVTAFIGPSGCGKSTFLRTLNRMNDIIPGTRVEGEVLVDGRNIYEP